jgi:hypothetical protein
MNTETHCSLCNLPFKVAISALPLATGAIAAVVTGCADDDCSLGRRIFHGALAAGLAAAATAGVEALAQRVCQCEPNTCT